ncbi:MAG: hypothetical protein NC916_03025, partial [Candidatus Omnitrophica bacterium]|nr:hypothetical protein [Candidatus Omnitrophota bacterium]
MGVRLLGETLVNKGFISKQQLDEALKKSPENEEILGRMLVKLGYLKEEQLYEVLSELFKMPFYPHLKEIEVSAEIIKAVPIKFIQLYGFMPLQLKDNVLTIAISNPMDVWLAQDLKLSLGFQVQRVLSTRREIDEAIRKYYGIVAGTVDKILSEKKDDKSILIERQEAVEEIEKSAEEASVIKLVNQVLSEAIRMNATDIHLELYQNKVHLRYRIDG